MTVDWSSVNFKTDAGLTKLNEHLTGASYIAGFHPTQDDVTIAKKVATPPPKSQFVHAARWYKNICYYTEQQKAEWPKGSIPVEKKKAEEEEIDLFGETTEEDKKATKKAAAEKTSAAKESKKVVGKSTLVFEVKPADEKTNLDVVEKEIRKISMDGLEWSGASKKVPVAYGLFKLQMGAVIIDDLVQTESILEQIECIGLSKEDAEARVAKRNAGEEDEDEEEEEVEEKDDGGMVQSAEIVSFQKL